MVQRPHPLLSWLHPSEMHGTSSVLGIDRVDGFEVCKRLKRHEAMQHIPVIFLTALDDPADKMCGFDVGGVDYITKAFEHQEVEARATTLTSLTSGYWRSLAFRYRVRSAIDTVSCSV